jgi:4'-phosphopantetheinyl transferase EntD
MNYVDAMCKLSGIELFLFPFEECESTRLESIAARVLLPNSSKRTGKSRDRMRAYWAGRATLAVALNRLGLEAFVSPDPNYGYLRAVDSHGNEIPKIFLNVSHTESIVAAVLSPFPVGVDIELASRDASRVVSRVASSEEISKAELGVYATNGKVLNPNIALWSAKEAAAKAVGLGMKFGLQNFEIHFSRDDIYRVKNDRKGPLELRCPALVIESFDPYIISVCSEAELLPSGRIGRSLVSSFDLI